MITKIISGGQTGVDLAAAQAALDAGIAQGGYCPKGRRNEQGLIPSTFNFEEVSFDGPDESQKNIDKRTIENIKHSDGTLIIVPTLKSLTTIPDGTQLTISEVTRQDKPVLYVALSGSTRAENCEKIVAWINTHNIRELNVAGPRESSWPGIYRDSLAFFSYAFPMIKNAKVSEWVEIPTAKL